MPALRANTRPLVDGIAQRRKHPAMAALAAGGSNGGGAYGHGGSLAALVLMDLRQKALLEAIEFIQRQRPTLAKSKQGL